MNLNFFRKKVILRNSMVLSEEDKEKIYNLLQIDNSISIIWIHDIKCWDNEWLSIVWIFEDIDFRNSGIWNKVMWIKPVYNEYFLNDLAKILETTPYLKKYFDIN